MIEATTMKHDPLHGAEGLSSAQLEELLRAECGCLEMEIAAYKARTQRTSLPKTAKVLAMAVSKKAGRKAASRIKRDPLPFAAAIGGVSWFAATILARPKHPDGRIDSETPYHLDMPILAKTRKERPRRIGIALKATGSSSRGLLH